MGEGLGSLIIRGGKVGKKVSWTEFDGNFSLVTQRKMICDVHSIFMIKIRSGGL